MNMFRPRIALVLLSCVLLFNTERAFAGIGTTFPVSAESGTSIAGNLFPVGLKLQQANLLLTGPALIYIDAQRLGLRVRFQAYDHRPAQGIAESETGWMLFSGKLGFDQESREILLHEPSMDNLEFDRDNTATRRFNTEMMAAWSAQVGDPIRSEIPSHPYILPFRDNIRDLSYDGNNINISIVYQ